MLLSYFDAEDNLHEPGKCEIAELRKLRDRLLEVADKLGAGMPILTDPVVVRARELKRVLG